MNVNTFLGANVAGPKAANTANAAAPSTAPVDTEPGEIVYCCMFGDRESINVAFTVWFASSAIGTAFIVFIAYIFEWSLVIAGSVCAGLACLALLCSGWYHRAGKQTGISNANV